jgi:menaquinone-dependent protoporphyrinogen oxidase
MSAHAPRVLVVVASRHGATAEIAVALARSIADSEAGRAAGLSAVTMPADQRPDPAAFDAVLLGSAVYAGNWLEPAREYATRHADVLGTRPVWLFSSGPIGEPPFPPDEAYDVAPLRNVTGAKEHRTFRGRMDKDRLSFGGARHGHRDACADRGFRDWDAVRRWGGEIAGHIAGVGEPTAVGT